MAEVAVAVDRSCVCASCSESSLKLEHHVDAVAGLEVKVRKGHLVDEGLAAEDKTNHGHVNAFLLLQRLLDLQHRVGWLEVERLLDASESLTKISQARLEDIQIGS